MHTLPPWLFAAFRVTFRLALTDLASGFSREHRPDYTVPFEYSTPPLEGLPP